MKKHIIPVILIVILGFSSCSKSGGGGLNFFSINDDIAFGAQLDSTILADPVEYPILSRSENPEVYAYIEGIMNLILESDEINYKDEFPWQVRIIDKDVLNAFAAPGGYLYFYTGFIKYAQSEAELAGVMAHEIGHADHRHSTKRLTKIYGWQVLISLALGNDPGQLAQIASQLALNGAALKFSRDDEYEADASSVRYLNSISSTRNYDPRAIIDFFDRMRADSLSSPDRFEFLRTHPYDENRIQAINELWIELGKPEGEKFVTEHDAIVAKLN